MTDLTTPQYESNEDYLANQNKVMQARVEKMQNFAASGRHPFANDFKPSAVAQEVLDAYGEMDNEALEAEAVETRVAGRIMSMRKFGKAAFVKVKDRSGLIQLHVRKDLLGEDNFAWFKKLDVGDIVGAQGTLFKTKTGELSVRTQQLQLLTKSLRPLPEKWHGLTDTETRLRQRYVDCIVNDEVREIFAKRAVVLRQIRAHLDEMSFLEVETPMMHPTPGGAAAKPFVTHHNALDIDLFLRIAPELYLKRLIVGGFERVYEINRSFRNEGISRKHNPEFTMLEFYWAYADYSDLMDMTEAMVARVCQAVRGTTTTVWGGEEISFASPWRRVRVREAVAEAFEIDESELARREVLVELCSKLPERLDKDFIARASEGHLLMELFDQMVESTLIQPTFVYEYPASVSPLSRRNDETPEFVDRFELFIAGMELANGFSELNDPIDQRARFLQQLEDRAAGDDEAHPMDDDYIRALEYGMPPTAGEGIGIDRLVMLLTGSESIREVILFPQLRPEG